MRMDSVSNITDTTSVGQVKTETKEVKKEDVKREEKSEVKVEETTSEKKTNQITIDQEKLKKIVEQLKESAPNAEPKFGIHEATNRMMVKLVDKDTQEVIKEFPLEKTLDSLAITLDLAGTMVDEKL